nr:DNA cytosine methyltransferase [Alistipes senegalensis]
MTMTHASLFSGIGGFDLAAEWAGWTNAFNCEIDPFCRKVLKYHFPDAEQYEDIRTTDFTIWRDRIDVLTGGFPCQPFSLAGKRKGTEDDRYLWPEMLRVIRTVRPRWVVGENVFGIVNWSEGMVFDKVCSDLEAAGYEVQPYIIPACGVGAPHRRDRCWFVAHARSDGGSEETEQQFGAHAQNNEQSEPLLGNGASAHCTDAGIETMREGQDGVHAVGTAADADCFGGREIHDQIQSEQPNGSGINCDGSERNASDASCLENNRRRSRGFLAKPTGANVEGNAANPDNGRLSERNVEPIRNESYSATQRYDSIPNWDDFPTQSPVCSRNDGLSGGLDGITVPKWRNQSIKGFGNAVVPQVPLQLFETIKKYENLTKHYKDERSNNEH